jgi:hypothetical protein
MYARSLHEVSVVLMVILVGLGIRMIRIHAFIPGTPRTPMDPDRGDYHMVGLWLRTAHQSRWQ